MTVRADEKPLEETKKAFALVTGASKGIGKSIAISLAKRGFNLLLLARSAEELNVLRRDLIASYPIIVDVLPIDLADQDSPKKVLEWVLLQGYPLCALVNNAGYGLWGRFTDLGLNDQLEMCMLNMNTVSQLCHLLLPTLLKQKQSYILNISSTAAYQAVPTLAIYSATKAFVLSFTRALRFELKHTSVSVSCLSPGPVDTGFAHRAGLDALAETAKKFNMQPDEVAEIAVKGMLAKKAEIVPGFTNFISVFATRLLPKTLIESVAASIYNSLTKTKQ